MLRGFRATCVSPRIDRLPEDAQTIDAETLAAPRADEAERSFSDLIARGREGQDPPIFLPRSNAAAAPLEYLSSAMNEVLPAVSVNGSNAMLVLVPHPARSALHELLVSQMHSEM